MKKFSITSSIMAIFGLAVAACQGVIMPTTDENNNTVNVETNTTVNTGTDTTVSTDTDTKVEVHKNTMDNRPSGAKETKSGDVIDITGQPTGVEEGEAITGITNYLGDISKGASVLLTDVVKNYKSGIYATSTGTYSKGYLTIPDGESKTVYISTKPNCSIRTIISPYDYPEVNKYINRKEFNIGYNLNLSQDTSIFTAADPYPVVVTNEGENDKVYFYFTIDNDNTNSYFNKESCQLNLGVK